MPNSYFQFKQFTVHQQRAALKVSTDNCLFGAWLANKIENEKIEFRNVLDVGAGTGLLMLMLAQKCSASVDGIEIDELSFLQACENTEAAKWSKRLKLIHADAKQFPFQKKYDFIISNPPFYEGDLKSVTTNRNIAMHDDAMKLDELITVAANNLAEDGNFAVLLPYKRADAFITAASQSDFFLLNRCDVKQSTNHSCFRSMLWFAKQPGKILNEEICIKDDADKYTAEFIRLLKDYYLHL